MTPESDSPEQPVDPLFLAEFACWTAVALAPFLTWVNGPPVSTDQAVVRTIVVGLALTGAIGLRIGRIVRGRRAKAAAIESNKQPTGEGKPSTPARPS